MIGAAFTAAAPGVPSWSTGFKDGSDMGGLIGAVLAPAGGFGKFLLVLIAVSTSSACAPTIYSFGEYSLIRLRKIIFQQTLLFFNFLTFHPFDILRLCCQSLISYFFLSFFLANCFMAITHFFARVPRYVFTVISTAM